SLPSHRRTPNWLSSRSSWRAEGLAVEQGRAAGAHDVGVETCARFGGPPLRLEVHMYDPEPLRVAVTPLVVVQQGPGEIAPQIHAAADGVQGPAEVPPVIVDPQRIFHRTIRGLRRIRERSAVLRDVQGQVAGPPPVAPPDQRLGEP